MNLQRLRILAAAACILLAPMAHGATETTPVVLKEGDYIPVDTGDALPEGCDAVVMIEDCIECEGGVTLYSAAAPWQHIRQIGEDVSAGDMILPSYTLIDPAAAGAMLAGGVLECEVIARPRVAIIPTGDELVPPTDDPKAGEIIEFNSTIFSGMLRRWGAEPVVWPIVPDRPDEIKAAVAEAASGCDMILLGAGTSAGRDDDTTSVIYELGELFCHGVAIKPGKPAALGRIGAKPVLGVPGYPVSGMIVLEEMFKPVIERWFARTSADETQQVKLSRRINKSLKYREFVRATLSLDEGGELYATPLGRGAGVVTSFVKAGAILDLPQDSEGCEAGESVSARLLIPRARAARTISVVGSHDPLIDEAADILRRGDPSLFVSSAHVGSSGALAAVARGEAQLGGIHLLDEKSGEYNISYVEKNFPRGGAALVECVERVQGLICAKGNPKSIKSFADIASGEISYVNRQRGSGTRILCDYLLSKEGVDPAAVYGYSREEFTHTGVAAQIAAGSADCGLGIYSAAKIYDLEFIPVCSEQYDLLVSLAALERETVKAFLDVIAGEKFRKRLEALGGYTLKNPGEVRKIWQRS